MRIVNLCPHAIDLLLDDGRRVVIPPAQRPARVLVTRGPVEERKLEPDGAASGGAEPDGAPVTVPVTISRYGEVVDLPGPAPDVCYVVSYPVAYACAERDDLLIPDDLVRDGRGVVVACRSLTRIAPGSG